MATYEYTAPPTVTEAIKILKKNENSRIIAGGTDLMVKIRHGAIKTGTLVDIKNINRIKGIRVDEKGCLWIGPLATHTQVAQSPVVRELYPFLCDASKHVGSVQIRNRGTIGGNVCNGSPAAETLPCLYVLDAKLHLEGYSDEREVPIKEFCSGPQKTCLGQAEMLTGIEIPPIKGNYGGVYLRHARRKAVDIAMVTCAVMWVEDQTKPVGKSFRIALGSVAPTVVRAKNAEEYLNSVSVCSDEIIEEAAKIALSDVSPIDDIRTTCDYRRDITLVLLKRAIGQLVCQPIGGEGE